MRFYRRRGRVGAIALVAALVVTGNSAWAGSSRSGADDAGATLVYGEVNPFTGPQAADGGEMLAGCLPAVLLINDAGGIMGHKVRCVEADTHGDPVDAVPAVRQLLATQPNLAGVLGPGSSEAASSVPLLDTAHMTMFAAPGQSAYDRTSYQYFWRILPPDDAEGYAMALWAHLKGYTRGAAVFANDVAAQNNVPTLLRGFAKLGGTIVINESIAQDQSSYRAEIVRMLAAKPQVIFMEGDPQTDATYLVELKQLHGLLPLIGTAATLQTQWLQAVTAVLGKKDFQKYWVGVQPYAAPSGPAWQVFDKALLDRRAAVPQASAYVADPWSMTDYDGANIMALAMIATKSTSPAVYNAAILRITSPAPGATRVYSFKQGEQALLAGKRIQYIGAGGPILFNKYHNSLGAFESVAYGNGQLPELGFMSAAQVAALNR